VHGYHTAWTAIAANAVVHNPVRPGRAPPARPETSGMHPLLRACAERQLGLFTAVDARRAGYQHPEIRHLCSSGAWVRLRRGIYVTAEELAAIDQRGRRHRIDCLAVLLDLGRPTAVISHVSAARLWGLPVRRGHDPTVRLTDPTLWRRGRNFHMSRAPLRSADLTTAGPLRLTTVPRTLVDCAREWELDGAVVAMDAALLSGQVTARQLQEALASARHWPGAPRAARAVTLADGRAESPLETRGRLRLLGAGFPAPALQVEIRAGRRLVGVVDAWYEDAAVAVEFDGRVKYTDPWRDRTPERVLWDEKRREDNLRSLDIRVVRITDADLGVRWPNVETRLRDLLATPGPGHRRFTAVARAHGVARAG
jgi:predicted transcriptional regulator of viral defense system